jgi:hypothetical protein
MKWNAAYALATFTALAACGNKDGSASANPRPTPTNASASANVHAAIVANNFSGGEYTLGVADSGGNTSFFYFLTGRNEPVAIKVGSRLVFEKSGEAIVTQVDVADQAGQKAVFVHVGRKLDPQGDGFPHPIRIEAQ